MCPEKPWWWNGRHEGLIFLSALPEKRDVECRKFKEALTGNADGNLEPSLNKEGAETRHGTPKDCRINGEGIVRTTNEEVTKVIVVRKSLGPQGLYGFESRPRHNKTL